jgi:CDP-diacylglycerol---glycerol-3-phosphate 3-phosphatidyltransferase
MKGRIRRKVKEESKKIKGEIKDEVLLNIPNTLTIFRLLFVFVFVYMLFNHFSKVSLLIVFIIAALTDYFDGYLARKLHQTTSIGARMDQVIDRIFTLSIALSLFIFAFLNNHEGIRGDIVTLLILSLSREIIAFPGFLINIIRNKDPYKVRFIGKVTTFVQAFALGAIILDVSFVIYPVIITCFLGIVSGYDYLRYSLS